MNMQSEVTQQVTKKKLVVRIFGVILLVVALCITTFALSYPRVSVDENTFQTGILKLNLNGGEQILNDQEFLLEPGRTMVKNFYIENEGTIDVYYNLYLENVSGGLADILDVSIKEGDEVLFEGKASDLNKQNPAKSLEPLKESERCTLTLLIHMPENTGNSAKNQIFSFDVRVDAVQSKNNPDRQFA